LTGLFAFALITRLRSLGRPTPVAIALAMGAGLVLAASIAPPKTVVAMWLAFYYVMGALSLFTQMATHTVGMDVSASSQPETAHE
jgi:hypothetical protein